MSGPADALDDGMARTLRTIAFAMGAGLALLTGISVFLYSRSAAVVPTPRALKLVNMMTILSAGYAFAAIVASEIIWKKMLSGAVAANVNAKTQLAFVVRAAVREGAAILGAVTLFLACQNGVVRAYPAYWVDLAPTALFWSFLFLHWPSLENLKAELEEMLPEDAVKVWVKTFGCRVNQAEGESLKASLLSGGSSESEGFEDADVCVVNTCTVTAEADREALALLRRVVRRNPAARLVVTGCLATRDPELVRTAAPSAVLVGNDAKAEIPAMFGCSPAPAEAALPSVSGRSRAFLKVQDGCNMTCTYCTIPSIRPALSTVPLPDLLERVRALAAAGVPEIVLCGIRLGRYLHRAPGERVDLGGLVSRMLEVPGDFRVRLSSLEVTDASDRLLSLMASSKGRLCPSLHLPLQSGSDPVLKRMKRWYSAEYYRRRVDAYRAAVPEGALFSDIITGFPGETEAEHEESFRFAESTAFDGLHVFRYSPRPGTAAAAWKVPDSRAVGARSDRWRALDAAGRAAHAARSVGQVRTVAPELSGRDGLTEDFLTVSLDRPVLAGLLKVRVDRADGRRASAVVFTP